MCALAANPDLGPTMEAHLLGRIGWSDCEELQRRIVAELAGRDDGQIRLLLCEHPDTITIGRSGSESEVRRNSPLVRSGQVPILWAKRGGGAMLHTPGQLLVYPLVPLAWHGLTLGDYLRQFEQAILATLQELGIGAAASQNRKRHATHDLESQTAQTPQCTFSIDGRTGRLVTFGVTVQRGVTLHGAAINVCPRMGLFHLVAPADGAPRASCLSAERGRPIGMAPVRAELVRQIAAAFGCERYHLYSGHPLLRRMTVPNPAAVE